MLTQSEILQTLKELQPILKRDFAVEKIGVFGSYATNRQNETSDIDILVEFSKPIGWKYLTLEMFLQDIFKTKVDLVTNNALKHQIKDSIKKQYFF
jgi:uncharacterized protein